MSSKKKFFVTTPIYYVNDKAHCGHSYTTIIADVLARYHRLKDEKVFFLVGTDEHGGKIEEKAKSIDKDVQQLCDDNSKFFKEIWRKLNISYDNFIRTTDLDHIKSAQKALQFLYDKGFIYKGSYEGLYCLGCEQYKTKSDLIDNKCPDHKTEPELIKEESYLFKLSQFEDDLRKKIESDEFEIKPVEKKNEVLAFLKQGLRDISISRKNVKWGIPLPFDPKFTAYVWVDAFLNYLTGIGWNGNPKELPEFWPPNIQLMSKDILRVHATIWPALLMALGISLPKKLSVHGYFTINGQKMSTSLGNVIWPEEMIEKFGVDATRYLLISVCSFGRDGDISWEKLTEKYNSDLAKGLGNLLARVITIAGKVKTKPQISKLKGVIDKTWKEYRFCLDELKLKGALISIWELISYCDKYVEQEKIWEKPEDKLLVVNDLLFALAEIAQMLKPFLPDTSDKIFKQLKTKKSEPLFPRV